MGSDALVVTNLTLNEIVRNELLTLAGKNEKLITAVFILLNNPLHNAIACRGMFLKVLYPNLAPL